MKLCRAFGALAAATVAAYVLSLPAAALAAVTEITMWHAETPPHRVETFQKLIDEFEKANPDVKIRQQTFSWDSAYTQLFSAIQARSAPDLVFTTPDFTIMFQQMGVVQAVDDIVREIDEKYGYIPSQVKPYYYDGHYWAVPTWSMVLTLYYRPDWFQEAGLAVPTTWDEMLAAGKALKQRGHYLIALPQSRSLWGDQVAYSFMVTNRGTVFDPAGKIAFDSPNNVETLAYLKRLSEYSPPGAINWNWGDGHVAFVSGQVAMLPIFGGLRNWEMNAPDLASIVRGTYFPIPAGGVRGSYSAPNAAMVLTTDKKKVAAIGRFLNFLMEPDRNGWWLSHMEPGTYLPLTRAAAEAKSFWEYEVIARHTQGVRNSVESLAYGKLFGFEHDRPNPAIGPISAEHFIAAAAQSVYLNKMTPEQAARWAAQQMRAAAGER